MSQLKIQKADEQEGEEETEQAEDNELAQAKADDITHLVDALDHLLVHVAFIKRLANQLWMF